MNKLIIFLKKMNPDLRFSLKVIFSLPILVLFLYLISEVFTVISNIFFTVLGSFLGLISVIESLIPSQISDHSEQIVLGLIVVYVFFSTLKNIDEVHKKLYDEIKNLRERLEKIEKERK